MSDTPNVPEPDEPDAWPDPAEGDDEEHDEPWLKQMVTPRTQARLDAYRHHLQQHDRDAS